VSGTMWGGDELDLAGYLARIGRADEGKPDPDTLRSVHRSHVAAFPFENLDIVLDRPPRLDVGALQAKMVRQRRGGYCHEQNLLFAAALERIGFTVTGLGARIRMGPATVLRPVTHMLLRIAVDGREWIADVGFGGGGLLEPVLLRDGEEARQGDWRFRIRAEPGGGWALSSLRAGGWTDLYAFTLEERIRVDYDVMNHFTATHPRSPFVGRPVVQRTEPGGRRALVGTRLSFARPDGSGDERIVRAGELRAVLREDFGIELGGDDLAKLAQRYRFAT
jgi:N-hydroxyarylamine O-acetyltransferase